MARSVCGSVARALAAVHMQDLAGDEGRVLQIQHGAYGADALGRAGDHSDSVSVIRYSTSSIRELPRMLGLT